MDTILHFIDNSYEGCHAQIILDLLPKAATAFSIELGCTYMYNEANRCIAAMYRICRQLHLKSETLNKENHAFSDFEQRFFRSNNFSEKHKTLWTNKMLGSISTFIPEKLHKIVFYVATLSLVHTMETTTAILSLKNAVGMWTSSFGGIIPFWR